MTELPIGKWGQRGTWHGQIVASNFSKHRIIMVSCPSCACDSSLVDHTIDPSGIVSPVFYCPYGCGRRCTLKLLGYVEWLSSLPHVTPEKDSPKDDLLNSGGDSSNNS